MNYYEKINKEINEYVLYEKKINKLSEIESTLQIVETDEYYLIKARLAFIKLYPVSCDFTSIKDLITCLEDDSDERNPTHWLLNVSDGANGKSDYVKLCDRSFELNEFSIA